MMTADKMQAMQSAHAPNASQGMSSVGLAASSTSHCCARYYPWALLLFWQLLMPGVSFLGHLGGVLAGQAYAWGWLRWAVPSSTAYQARPLSLGPSCMPGSAWRSAWLPRHMGP